VVHPGELHGGLFDLGGLGVGAGGEALDAGVEVEEERAVGVLADHALDPEEAADAVAAGYRLYAVQARGWVEDHRAGGELDRFFAVVVLDDELAAIVVGGVGEEERGAEVGADALGCGGELADGRVDVRAEGLAAGVAVEHRREDPQRECCRHEARRAGERGEDEFAQLVGGGCAFADLGVALDFLGLVASRDAAVDPLGCGQLGAGLVDLVGGEEVVDGEEHGGLQEVGSRK
jgi:hypothetical protein